MDSNVLTCSYLSQEDLLKSGCLDFNMAIQAAEEAMLAFEKGEILFPEKIVQIFSQETQERINCLPATVKSKKICGMKWVSVFPNNPALFGMQNLSAVMILSEIEKGFPLAFMEGTLCSNIRVGAMGAIAAKYFARKDSKSIGFIGAGEQAKMHLIAMKTVLPTLEECRVAAKTEEEEKIFIQELQPIFPQMSFVSAKTDLATAMSGADVLVTATSVQTPLLKAEWMKPGAFYSHVGGWEDEYAVAKQCDKIICDDWDTVKHRTQTLSRMYKDKELKDSDLYANLVDVVSGKKEGRQSDDERIYFNAVGLAYVDVAIAIAMYERALKEKAGQQLKIQDCMIFQHKEIKDWVRL